MLKITSDKRPTVDLKTASLTISDEDLARSGGEIMYRLKAFAESQGIPKEVKARQMHNEDTEETEYRYAWWEISID
jgi:hypothetical protein